MLRFITPLFHMFHGWSNIGKIGENDVFGAKLADFAMFHVFHKGFIFFFVIT